MKLFIVAKRLAKNIFPHFVLNSIKKKHYLNVLKEFNFNDEKDLNIVKYLVNQNESVIDIGANIGIYSKFLSEFVGNSGQVFAFEPIPLTYNFLKNNMENLGLNNVMINNIALSDTKGKVNMEIPKVIAGENYFRARIIKNKESNYKLYQVDCNLLDNIIKHDNSNISFIKCDVEGHELSVLKGSRKTIEKTRCSLLVEINEDPENNVQAKSVVRFLEDLHYKPFWFDGEVLRTYKKGDRSINYFFLLPGHLQKLTQSNIKIE